MVNSAFVRAPAQFGMDIMLCPPEDTQTVQSVAEEVKLAVGCTPTIG